ncbi:competence/damage-inducible domain protein CinA [Firmicutes bacterium CAG:534]|nr:competence/damage-inducible domain protein CinA [Firmicutes bacterium CAG:534]
MEEALLKKEEAPESRLVKLLLEKDLQITCAESCTGGMIASLLVNVPGVSEILMESYVTYSNEAKHRLLGVEQEALSEYGAVSQQVAFQMAEGAARAAGADAAIAVTGIAGPGGGTAQKPVGLVYIGTYLCGNIRVTENHFLGERYEIRKQAAEAALLQLTAQLTEQG